MGSDSDAAGWIRLLLWKFSGLPCLSKPARWARRRYFLPSEETVLRELDQPALLKIREKHAPGQSDDDLRSTRAAIKYLDPRRQVKRNLRRVSELELHGRPALRILDLGCGAGYFLKICDLLGHHPQGFDLDESAIFRDVVEALGVERTIGRIEPGKRIPVDSGPFDLITAFAVCFNDHNAPKPWGAVEWKFFLEDVTGRLLSGKGQLLMKLNPRDASPGAGECISPEVGNAFRSWGLEIDGQWVSMTRKNFLKQTSP